MEGWQWANKNDKFLVAIRIMDPYRDTGKTCLGGGMHCPRASTVVFFVVFENIQKY